MATAEVNTGGSLPLSADVLLVTVTPIETRAVLETMGGSNIASIPTRTIDKNIYYDLGSIAQTHVVLVRSGMGTGGRGAAQQTVATAIQAVQPLAVIMVGIAFGAKPEERGRYSIGDVLVARNIFAYDIGKVVTSDGGETITTYRGERVQTSTRLVRIMEDGDITWDRSKAAVHFGLLLTGEKVIANRVFRDKLLEREPEALGGEMEALGVYTAAQEADPVRDWIVVKAISDWGDAFKDDENRSTYQEKAAYNAAGFVLHVLQRGGLARQTSPARDPPAPKAKTELFALGLGVFPLALGGEMASRLLRYGFDTASTLITVAIGSLALLAILSLLPPGQRVLASPAHRLRLDRGLRLWQLGPVILVSLALVGLQLALPSLARWYSDEGARLQNNRQPDEALDKLQRAVALTPDDAVAIFNLGSVYEDLSQYELAERSYRAALSQNSDLYYTYNNLAYLLIKQKNNYSDALTLLEQLEQRNPQEPIVQYTLYKNRGWALFELGNYLQAEIELKRAIQLNPQGAAAHCLLAMVLDKSPEPNSAKTKAATDCLRYEASGYPPEPHHLDNARELLNREAVP